MDRTVYLSITVLCLGVLTIIFDVLLFILNYISEKPLSFSHPLRKSSIITLSFHFLLQARHVTLVFALEHFHWIERDEIEVNLGWTCKKSTWCWPYLWIHNHFRKLSKFWWLDSKSGLETILNRGLCSYLSAVDHERFTTGDWRTIKIQYTWSIWRLNI